MSDPARAAQDALGALLLEAARGADGAPAPVPARDAAAAPPADDAPASRPARDSSPARSARRPRWRRPAAVLALTGVLGLAATAAAVNLISVGEPLPDRTSPRDDYRPAAPGSLDIVARAPDRPLPWGVAVYTAANGEPCVLAGQLRGASLGRIENGRFRAYERGTTGACGNVERLGMVVDMLDVRGPQPRAVLFGRARASATRLVFEIRGERHVVTPGRGGGFILVFEGQLRSEDIELRTIDSRASGPE